jgi:Ca2+-binding RTX toxin-like protein
MSRAARIRLILLACLGTFAVAAGAAADLNPVDISPAGVTASRPLIATDGAGDVVAVWRELEDRSSAIRAAVRPKGGDWSSKRISAAAAATESPAVAMDRRGNAVAVWHQSDGSTSVVQAAVRPAGEDWSDTQDLSGAEAPAFNADVAVEAGYATAVWVVLRNRHTLVLSSSRTIDGAWSAPETVAGPVGNPGAPVVALDDHGNAVAAWQWWNGAYRVVQAAAKPLGGTWSAPQVLSGPGRTASRPRLVMDGEGRAVAGWIRSNGDWTVAQAASRAADGSWGPPTDLSNRAGNDRGLDLAMTRDGHAIAAWRQGSPNANLWSSSRPPGTTRWGDPSPVAQEWPGIQADVTLDEEGNATAVWSSSSLVSASFKPVGKPWQDDYLLSSYDDATTSPAVAAQGLRVATAVWIRAGEEVDRIQSVNYDIDTSAKEAEDVGDDEEGGDEGDDTEDGEEVMGTAHADRLIGTPRNDVFYGLGGNDVIVGRGGRDVVFGGPGDDRMIGGAGSDRLFGGVGRDRLSGGRGADVLVGGAGRDFLRGGFGNDTLRAKDGLRDRVFGGRGLDQYRLDRWLDRAVSIESRAR